MQCFVKRGKRWMPAKVIRLCMSVGHGAFEGESLVTILRWCKDNADQHHLILADSLQRYNLFSSYSPSESLRLARLGGDEWIDRNKSILEAVGLASAISRWDDWTQKDKFRQVSNNIKNLYESVDKFRAAVDEDVDAYLSRRALSGQVKPEWGQHGRDYVIEEVAFCEYFCSENFAVEVYPGSEPRAIRIMRMLPELSSLSLSKLQKIELKVQTQAPTKAWGKYE